MGKHSRIEKKWDNLWKKTGVHEPDLKRAKRPFYNLMMFPYPSAEGLHIGSVRTFTGVDIYGRFKRMQGNEVFEPMGLDGFGIHAENFALKTKRHPAKLAKITEKNFYRQLGMIGNSFAWNEKLETYDPAYYKWTQWIFTEMFRRGLAYRKKQQVNWCPSCLTVLADEQVISGECERCGTKVIKKDLEQWFFKITNYAERLLQNLETLDWSEKIKIAQKNWIGKSEGASIKFPLVEIPGQEDKKHSVEIFTTRPDTLFGVTFMVISPELAKTWLEVGWRAPGNVKKYIEESLANRVKEEGGAKEKTGIFSGIYAINPANQEKVPVWISDYVLAGYGTGAIMAVPAHDERDYEFAKKFNLPIRQVVSGEGILINSGKFTDMDSIDAKWKITKFAGGEKKVQYRLRDWLLSRQRYWGPPIPMIFCEACRTAGKGERKEMPGWYAVPEKDLPIKLPFVKDFRPRGTGQSPLASIKSFYEVKCPACKSEARRETDVSDTFLDSAWYFLRYPSVREKKRAWNEEITKTWLPVNMYIGGAEHSVLHLLYSRFLTMAFFDAKMLPFEEPFTTFRAHGLITKGGVKMSKSKGNIVDPDRYFQTFGADAMRMYLAFLSPLTDGGDFRDSGIVGLTRFLARVNKLSKKVSSSLHVRLTRESEKRLHQAIKKVSEGIETLHYNVAISQLMILLSEFETAALEKPLPKMAFENFLKLLAPFAPYTSEELYQKLKRPDAKVSGSRFRKQDSIHLKTWPNYIEKLAAEENFPLIIQINGKTRGSLPAPKGIEEEDARALAFSLENVKTSLQGKKVQKIIFVPNRLINFVV